MLSVSNATLGSPHEGVWPTQRRKILDWLVTETRNERFIDNILVGMCKRLLDAGVPVTRATLHFRTHHPQWLGARILWRKGMSEAEIRTFDYGVEETAQYLNSPIYEINNGAPVVRRRLDEPKEDGPRYPLYDELQADGYTDYIAWPLDHTLDKRHVVTFRPTGPVASAKTTLRFLQIFSRR